MKTKCDRCIHNKVCKFRPEEEYPQFMKRILGLKPKHYLYLSDIGRELLNNRKMFLSKKAVNAFGGYATAQLRRLDNKSARLAEQSIQEEHVLNSIRNASLSFPEMYFSYP